MSADTILNTLSIKTSHYILGGVALVAALSWNEAIKKVIDIYVPLTTDQIQANIIYALTITIILVILIQLLPDTEAELPEKTKIKLKEIQYINMGRRSEVPNMEQNHFRSMY